MSKLIAFVVANASQTTGIPGAQLGIRVDEEDEMGLINRKQGFMPCSTDPAKQLKLVQAVNEGKLKFAFGPQNRQTRLYELIKLETEAPAVPDATIAAGQTIVAQ